MTICQAAEQLDRGGLLVFFPSYPALNDCVEHWRGSSLWSRLERGRSVVVEPRKAKDMRTIAVQFQRAASTTCAVLLAVCRGKASEGMDFSDDQCRVVIVTGVPYAPPDDPRVKAKRRFLDDKRRTGDKKLLLSGDAWYEQQACRAVNQAVGRCVRHAKDWGAVLLADSRFADAGRRKNLPAWLRHEIRQPAPFRDVAAHLRSFIDEHHGRKPAPKASEKTSTAFGLSSSSRPSAKPVVKTEDAFDSLKKLQRQVRKAPATVSDPRVSAFLAKRTKIEQPPAKALRREAPLQEEGTTEEESPTRREAGARRVSRHVIFYQSQGRGRGLSESRQESVAAQLMRESEPLRDPDISDADASTAIKRLARIPASLDALRESKAGRRLATYVRRVECPAAERLLERWKALATPAGKTMATRTSHRRSGGAS